MLAPRDTHTYRHTQVIVCDCGWRFAVALCCACALWVFLAASANASFCQTTSTTTPVAELGVLARIEVEAGGRARVARICLQWQRFSVQQRRNPR